MKKKYYVTTPIYYPSGQLHLGHAYSTAAADALARYKRLTGHEVMFLTGTDEHGQKIEINAHRAGLSPKEFVDERVAEFFKLWKVMDISYDKFLRTTDEPHKAAVQRIFCELYEKGDIYKGEYEGWYCIPCEAFWTKTQLKNGKCPDCNRDVHLTREDSYFFRLSKYAPKLLELYRKHPEFIEPQSRENEMVNFIEQGLEDLCISRTSFSWGIPVPFDKRHVIYVWLDALTNYVTAMGYASSDDENFRKFWPADVHLVGKEIVRFHAVIWPALLMSLDLPLPSQIFGHGWILFGDGSKMSKSKGNVVDPLPLCKRFGPEAIKYFLLREFPFGVDGTFTYNGMLTRLNNDLANDLGNLLSRTTSMFEKYFPEGLPENFESATLDSNLIGLAKNLSDVFAKEMEKFQFSSALERIFEVVSLANKFIEQTAPWALAKSPENRMKLAEVMYTLCDVLRIVAICLSPFMPSTAEEIMRQLTLSPAEIVWENAENFGLLPKNAQIKKGPILFQRLDVQAELAELLGKNEEC